MAFQGIDCETIFGSGRQPTKESICVCISCCAQELLVPFRFLTLQWILCFWNHRRGVSLGVNTLLWVSKMAQWDGCKLETYINVEGENQLRKVVLRSPHLCHGTCAPPPMLTSLSLPLPLSPSPFSNTKKSFYTPLTHTSVVESLIFHGSTCLESYHIFMKLVLCLYFIDLPVFT